MVRKQISKNLSLAFSVVAISIAGCAGGNHSVNMQASEDAQPQPVQNITVMQANDLLAGEREHIFLDVRTLAEFEAGHPTGALNIPLLFNDPDSGTYVQNPNFLDVVMVNIPKHASVVVSCHSGGRSARAANMMHAVGYQKVSNMLGGWGGKHNSDGSVLHPGWHSQNYPTQQGQGGKNSYKSLRKKSGN